MATWSVSLVFVAVLVFAALPGRAMTPPVLTPAEIAQQAAVWRSVRTAQKLLSQNNLPAARQAADATVLLLAKSKPQTIPAPFIIDDLAPIYFRVEQYKQLASLYTLYPSYNLNSALAFDKSGQPALARHQYREHSLLVRHKDFKSYLPSTATPNGLEATLFLWRGIVYVDENNPASGVWALHHALKLIPHNPLALWYYAEALTNAGRSAEARPFFKAAIARDHGLVAQRAQVRLNTLQ